MRRGFRDCPKPIRKSKRCTYSRGWSLGANMSESPMYAFPQNSRLGTGDYYPASTKKTTGFVLDRRRGGGGSKSALRHNVLRIISTSHPAVLSRNSLEGRRGRDIDRGRVGLPRAALTSTE